MKIQTFCLTLDLQEDDALIKAYEQYHQPAHIWPEIIEGIKACNILSMKIYRAGNRLCMIMETNEAFDLKADFERMGQLPKQKEWAELMASFQKKLPFAKPDEHWVLMHPLFDLNDPSHA